MTEERKQDILRKVRALLAKAQSTTFEEERKAFLAKADELMETYAITEAMLRLKSDPKAKLVVRRDMDVSWWKESRGLDWDTRSEIYWLWTACVSHCRCVTGHSIFDWSGGNTPVFGTESDLDYLDLLFTDLFLQIATKLRPMFDPKADLGSQVRLAKEAGMTWAEILDWTGLNGTPEGKRLLPAYKKYIAANNLPQVKINPKQYQWSFVNGFCATVRSRLYEIQRAREGRQEKGSGMELALISIKDQAKEEMYQDFPDLRPHPAGCQCEQCRPKKSKAVAYRSRALNYSAQNQGNKEGANARIVSNDPSVGKTGELGK